MASLCSILGLVFAFDVGRAHAGENDWSQWRGPARDGHAADQLLMREWPKSGPPLKWTFDQAGRGYSSVSLVDGRLFTMGADDQNCFALCIDAATGKSVWKTNLSRPGTGDDYAAGWGTGPRGTPTIDGDQAFVLTDVGVVAALNNQTGDVLWSVDLVADFGGGIPKWGYSESPLIDGDRVIVTPGGDNFMIALDRQTGRLLWQSKGVSTAAHYVSVMKGEFEGTSFYVTASDIGVVAFDTTSGDKLFENVTTGNKIATIPTPILTGSQIYHTSDYGAGNVLLQLSGGPEITARQVYHLDGKTMMNHHGGVVLVDGVIYGFTKANGGTWMAQDLASGDTLWDEKVRPNKSGSIAFADERLYCYNDEDGTVILVQPDRQRWLPMGTLTIPRKTDFPRGGGAIWAHPVIADQTLFIRDQDLIFAFGIGR